MKTVFTFFGQLIVSTALFAQILTYNNTNPSPEGGFFSFPATSTFAIQDYCMDQTLLSSDSGVVILVNFVGGLTAAGTLRLEFLALDSSLISAWDYTLTAGIFNYNLLLDSVSIPAKGLIRVSSPNTSGQWYLNRPQTQVGSQDTVNSPKTNGLALVYALGITCTGGPLSCPTFVNFNQESIPSGTYVASAEIVTISTITSGSTVNLDAGQSTKLGSFFEVELGGILEVLNNGCIP